MEEMLVEEHGDSRWRRDTAVCLATLPDLAASGQVDDGKSATDQHEIGGDIVGIDCYRVWVV